MTDPQLEQQICRTLGASGVVGVQTIQSLWSGCGRVARVHLTGGDVVVIKHVKMPERISHPRGWDTGRSLQRKVRSYEVEACWYADWSARCLSALGTCRVPSCLGHAAWGDERLLILEDIDASGFDRRVDAGQLRGRTRAALANAKAAGIGGELEACIRWLAAFHAAFLGERPSGLWGKGTYWHLGTRPDEYEALEGGPLKRAARRIDAALDASPFQTIVHGDAKLANFCFSGEGPVAALDFQYAGGGCGMKDLAYFVGGCLDSDACFALEAHVLEAYFTALKQALRDRGSAVDTGRLEAGWRGLYPYAWADFERFVRGWSPGHWKISAYSKRMTEQALADLGGRD